MTLRWPEAGGAPPELTPYLADVLERGAAIAVRLHARTVSPEHFLLSMLADDACGAHRLIVHAFADPDTLHAEVLALAPGILVVGSGRSLPFSPRGVSALYAARAAAESRDAPFVEPTDLLAGAVAALPPGAGVRLREAAGNLPQAPCPAPAEGQDGGEPESPFAVFDERAKRALGRAAKVAAELRRRSVAPAHLVLSLLEREPELAEEVGLTHVRARMTLVGEEEEDPPPAARALEPDTALQALLAALPAAAGTVTALATIVRNGPEELQLLLSQQRITRELVERGGRAFADPEEPSEEE